MQIKTREPSYQRIMTQIAKFCRPQRGPMLAPWTLLSGDIVKSFFIQRQHINVKQIPLPLDSGSGVKINTTKMPPRVLWVACRPDKTW